ncbi:MAG: deoxyguanosinetriphosphate triphosphohydrolase [Desulfobacteraceae bacterium]|nr:deoxyguanosinetriphosphate triphosphohydrolase [Desulfobacteraceae bacterium]
MTIREDFEKREKTFLSPHGCLSSKSRGRRMAEEKCPIRTDFQRDKDRIVYSNAFRRLKHKTQVFLSPLADEYRTRLTHTLEVVRISRVISRAMRLNEDLTEAIALAHDLGHTPFGHSGEATLRELYSEKFTHNKQSLRVVDFLEKDGKGLNLTYEVRDGILKHSKGYGKVIPDNPKELPFTHEARVVRIADIMAYLNHDLDDAIRSGVIKSGQIPETCIQYIGSTHSQRALTMIKDLIASSKTLDGNLVLQMSEPVETAMTTLRQFLYDNVYRAPRVHKEFVKAKKILSELFSYFVENQDQLKEELNKMGLAESLRQTKARVVCDLISSMTDRYALSLYSKIFLPTPLF